MDLHTIGAKPEEARSLILFTLGLSSSPSFMATAVESIAEATRRLSKSLPA